MLVERDQQLADGRVRRRNMLLAEKERTSDLKICDFGLSAKVRLDAAAWLAPARFRPTAPSFPHMA